MADRSSSPAARPLLTGKQLAQPFVTALEAFSVERFARLDRLEASHRRTAERIHRLEERVLALETRPR